MIAIFIIVGILAFLLLLLLLPLHLKASFETDLFVKVRYTFISLTVYPRPEKLEKKEEPETKIKKGKKGKKELSEVEQMLQEEGVAAVLEYFSNLARLTGTTFQKVLAAITVDSLKLDMKVSSPEASSTAMEYGRACAVMYPSVGLLESVVHVRHRAITIIPDFTGDKSEIHGDIRFHVIPIRILWIGIQFFIGYIGNTMDK